MLSLSGKTIQGPNCATAWPLRPRPVSGPSQCASTHPSAAALPTPTAFHSSPAERKRIGVCLWSEGGRGDHSKSPLFWSTTNLQQGREGRRGVSSQFHSGPPLLPLTQSSSPFLSVPLLSPLTVGQMQQGFFNSFFPILISGTSTWSTDVGHFLTSRICKSLVFIARFCLLPMKLHHIKS